MNIPLSAEQLELIIQALRLQLKLMHDAGLMAYANDHENLISYLETIQDNVVDKIFNAKRPPVGGEYLS